MLKIIMGLLSGFARCHCHRSNENGNDRVDERGIRVSSGMAEGRVTDHPEPITMATSVDVSVQKLE